MGVRFGEFRIGSLLFADDVVLLASSVHDLQFSLKRFTAKYEAAGMKRQNSKFLPVKREFFFATVLTWGFRFWASSSVNLKTVLL